MTAWRCLGKLQVLGPAWEGGGDWEGGKEETPPWFGAMSHVAAAGGFLWRLLQLSFLLKPP